MKLHDVDKILQQSVKNTLTENKQLNEAFVAEPKKYKLSTDLISQKTKEVHAELYQKYAKAFTAVSAKIDTVKRSESNSLHSDFKSLKCDETYNFNALWLHELYFSNCYDPNSEILMDSLAFMRLQRDFGTFDDWQRDFVACSMAAGNGWAVCGYNMFLKRFINTIVNSHSDSVMLGVIPVIVLDMWEHAYIKDYGTDKKSYIISQMKELNWAVIEERFEKCDYIDGVK
jgi:Fe-Mn family superoxide dismutase